MRRWLGFWVMSKLLTQNPYLPGVDLQDREPKETFSTSLTRLAPSSPFSLLALTVSQPY